MNPAISSSASLRANIDGLFQTRRSLRTLCFRLESGLMHLSCPNDVVFALFLAAQAAPLAPFFEGQLLRFNNRTGPGHDVLSTIPNAGTVGGGSSLEEAFH